MPVVPGSVIAVPLVPLIEYAAPPRKLTSTAVFPPEPFQPVLSAVRLIALYVLPVKADGISASTKVRNVGVVAEPVAGPANT